MLSSQVLNVAELFYVSSYNLFFILLSTSLILKMFDWGLFYGIQFLPEIQLRRFH